MSRPAARRSHDPMAGQTQRLAFRVLRETASIVVTYGMAQTLQRTIDTLHRFRDGVLSKLA